MRLAFALALLPTALAATYEVQVGPNGELVFQPEYVSAAPGDTVNFNFNPKNHTVTSSAFNTPCVANGALDSGFHPVAPGAQDALGPFSVHVQDTNPLWFYCRQTAHCGRGMVFAINAPPEGSERSFSAFKALAIAQNGTAEAPPPAATTPPPATPPPPVWHTATATVSSGSSTWVTTYTSYEGSPSPTFAPYPVDHKIIVGVDGKLEYGPASISAAIGDTVTFEFRPKNHTVTQSSFLKPCTKLDGGFASGFQPVSADSTQFPTYQIKINDTAPIWGYCGQANHCASGMVFSVNAVESGPNNFAEFVKLAKQSNNTATPPSTSSNPAPSQSGNNNAASILYTGRATVGLTILAGLMMIL